MNVPFFRFRGHDIDMMRMAFWVAVLVGIGWAVAQAVQAFLQAHPTPQL